MKGSARLSGIAALVLAFPLSTPGQLNQNCTVSVLNRNVRVNPDGSWVLPNIPAGFGQVKARATCVQGGVTTSGESAFFSVAPNTAVNLPEIVIGSATPIPVSLSITPAAPSLAAAGQTVQLVVTATYPDKSAKDVSTASTGTNYTTSNAAIATLSPDGLLTAVTSGTVIIQAGNDGATGIITAKVALSSKDSDGDGIPDDIEISLGMNPNDPVDAQEDFDRDGLTNLDEVRRGTGIRTADSDADGLLDGDEVTRGTNPLLADSDGDLIPDGVEVTVGTNPLSASSRNLLLSSKSYQLTPSPFTMATSVLSGEVSTQLRFTALLIDNKTTIDLTAKSTGTTYSSNNVALCNFGAVDGLVFAGSGTGVCTITATNGTLTVKADGSVKSFNPAPLSYVSIPGTAMNVDVAGKYAYVAAGAAGLVVVDVSDRLSPRVVTTIDTPGNANDVFVSGNLVYVADGASGLRIYNISVPDAPTQVAVYDTPGVAQDVVVRGSLAFVADGTTGLQIIDVTNPAAPLLLGTRSVGADAQGVDYDPVRKIAVVAAGNAGLFVINASSPSSPTQIGVLAGGDVRDVVLKDNFAFLADYTRSFTSVDLTNPASPVLRGSTPSSTGGLLNDVAVFGNLAFGADDFFVNDVPIIDISTPATPAPKFLLPFRSFRDDNGTGIAVDSSYVYLTANAGDGRLYIGQWAVQEDRLGIPPTISMTAPVDGATVVQGETVTLAATAADDIGVAWVTFSVNGVPIYTDNNAPYQINYTAGALGKLTLSATAVDYGGSSKSAAVSLTVAPDPLTTVSGRVLDRTGIPVQGATVVVTETFSTLSGIDGRFTISGVPTVNSQIVATARKGTLFGKTLPRTAQRSGVTDAGDITMSEPPITLFPATVSAVGGPITTLVTADLNGDGRVDVVTGNWAGGGSEISILLGKGDGTFEPRRDMDAVNYLRNLVLSDVNLDGKLDIVAISNEDTLVSVFLGNGDGSFQARKTVLSDVGQRGRALAIADFNKDGFPDIAIAVYNLNEVWMLPGNGDGTFQPQKRFAAGTQPNALALADVNGDGNADIVTANSVSNNISVLLGRGDGTFQAQTLFLAGTSPQAISIKDLNGDGRPDVAIANDASNDVSILLGRGDGTFQTQRRFGVGLRPLGIAISDVNADGKFDVITANYGSEGASVLIGKGDGSFEPSVTAGGGNGPQKVAVDDINGDGRPDLLIGNYPTWNISIVLGTGDGTFPVQRKFAAGAYAADVVVADFNGDRKLDVAIPNLLEDVVSVLLGNGDGTFGIRKTFAARTYPRSVAVGDFNRDGRIDLVASAYLGGGLVLLSGNGDGTFRSGILIPTPDTPKSIVAADINRDGLTDIVIELEHVRDLGIAFGNGDGTFKPIVRVPANNNAQPFAINDLNGDGNLDFVTLDQDGTVTTVLGNGDGTFQIPRSFSPGLRPVTVAVGDFNKDGKMDVVLGGGGGVSVLLGNGDGTLGTPTTLSIGGKPGEYATDVLVADLNEDGYQDIAAVNPGSHNVALLLGKGDGTFSPAQTLLAGNGPAAVSVADVNGDGHPDLIVTESAGVTILLNQRKP